VSVAVDCCFKYPESAIAAGEMFKVNPPEEISTYANGASAQMTGPLSKEGYAVIDQVRTKSKKTPKTILSPMTVVFPEGCVTAIMGPSGSGKTTMLDTLTGSISSGVSVVGEGTCLDTDCYIFSWWNSNVYFEQMPESQIL